MNNVTKVDFRNQRKIEAINCIMQEYKGDFYILAKREGLKNILKTADIVEKEWILLSNTNVTDIKEYEMIRKIMNCIAVELE